MTNGHLQLINVAPEDLMDGFTKSLEAMEKRLAEKYEPKQPTEYLTRNEVCEILKIDLSTLWRWQKNGTLQGYSLNNRVYFKRSEIDEALNANRM